MRTSRCRRAPSAPDEPDADRIDAAILVVEDNIDVRRIVCRLLRDFGCTVIEANSGQAALDILRLRTRRST